MRTETSLRVKGAMKIIQIQRMASMDSVRCIVGPSTGCNIEVATDLLSLARPNDPASRLSSA